MTPQQLIDAYYPPGDPARDILLIHSRCVAAKAKEIARCCAATEQIDVVFVEEAALLHDIGIRFVHAPNIGCYGSLPYLAHGCEGRILLEAEGLPRHALVCERHIGVGLSAEEIRTRHLPLPVRDMLPQTLEEIIITYADLFFSKSPGALRTEKTVDAVRAGLARFGADKVMTFNTWHARFGRETASATPSP